ncbi:MAG: inositol monophosphatase family protein [Maricaulaceae bacterium]
MTNAAPISPKKAASAAERLSLMMQLREAARAITLPLFKGGMDIANKASGSDFDPVTNADTEGEKALRALIQAAFPDDSIEGEEFPDVNGSNEWLWTLDPIDGTRGFVAGIPVWSTLIAVSHKDVPIIGMIDHPALGESYFGDLSNPDDKRAWRLDDSGDVTPLQARPCAALKDAILGCTEPLSMLGHGELAAYNVIRHGTQFSRLGLDAYGYAMVASGRMDIIIEAMLKPCDVRALMPVIEASGGALTNWHGGNPVNGGRVVAVGDAGLLPELYTYLGRALSV